MRREVISADTSRGAEAPKEDLDFLLPFYVHLYFGLKIFKLIIFVEVFFLYFCSTPNKLVLEFTILFLFVCANIQE